MKREDKISVKNESFNDIEDYKDDDNLEYNFDSSTSDFKENDDRNNSSLRKKESRKLYDNSKYKSKKKSSSSKKTLHCISCEMAFLKYTEFDQHNWETHQIKPTCDVCGRTFKNRGDMGRHKQSHDEGKIKQITCEKCNINFDTYIKFDAHNLDVHQIKPSCDICGKCFNNRNDIGRHKKKHSGKKPFKCDDCGRDFACKYSLKSHIKCIHEKNVDPKILSCFSCDIIFYTFTEFDKHNFEVHQLNPSCDVCGKSFTDRYVMETHKKLHNKGKSRVNLSCELCQQVFYSYKNFDIHNLEVHQIKPSCNICNKTFKSRKDLWSHNRVHKERKIEKTFPCEVCGKKFQNSGNLKEHQLVHTGEKSFLCNDCGKAFGTIAKLKSHETIHTGEKPYSCELCNKQFRLKVILNNHMRSHTGEKPFSCEDCGSSFRQRCDLTVHKRTHTGEKPYSCDLCRKSFYSSSEISKHNKTTSHLNMMKTPKIDEDG